MILRTIILPSSKIITLFDIRRRAISIRQLPSRNGNRFDRAARQAFCYGRFHAAKLTEVYPRQGQITSGRPGKRRDFRARPAPMRG